MQCASVVQCAAKDLSETCNNTVFLWVKRAVCCSSQEYAAVCCSVLQYAAVCCSILQCAAAYRSVLQRAGMLQCTARDPQCSAAVCCSTPQSAAAHRSLPQRAGMLQCAAVRYCVLQSIAVCCSVPQCAIVCRSVLVYCSVLQHTYTAPATIQYSCGERWGAGVENHFQEFNEPYAPS